MRKLGLIAGGGGLPLEVARACTIAERPLFVVRLRGFADQEMHAFPGGESGIAEMGRSIKLLKQAGCEAVCFAGQVNRPDFSNLKPDLRGLAVLPGAIAAASRGDDELLRFLMSEFERDGFVVEGADQVVADLAIREGALGRLAPTEAHRLDIDIAVRAARALGDLDIGQAAVSARGLVLAMEAAEGTAALLSRVAGLPEALRGTTSAPVGVLAKVPKSGQDRRVDLPTIGVDTVTAVASAGLAGIVGEARGLLVVDREATVRMADELGIFIAGLPASRAP
jgi:UDP-2,3-diacylglucosamine hydrolase